MIHKTISTITAALLTTSLLSSNVCANERNEIEALKKEIQELREMTQILMKQTKLNKKEIQEKISSIEETQQVLVDETSDLKTGFTYTTVDTTKSYNGLASAASKVYYSKSPLSIGGYGEMYYAHTQNSGKANTSKADLYRFVPYIGYKFSDNIILNTEIEFEHGGIKDGAQGDGYVIVEFMYLDFLINPKFNFRIGNMLVPMGLVNEKHEPTLFTTVQRPNTSKMLIPSTWHENGAMIYGEIIEDLTYKFGGFTALDLSLGANSANNWLRDSRIGSFGNTDRGDNEDNLKLAIVSRIDYSGISGLNIGLSSYIDPNLKMYDLHADYSKGGFRTYGVYTQTNRSKTINGKPEKAKGGFINIGYDLLSFTKSNHKLPVFFQYENVSPQDKVTNTLSGNKIKTKTIGINYFPHDQVVLKLDHVKYDTKKITSLSLGFIF